MVYYEDSEAQQSVQASDFDLDAITAQEMGQTVQRQKTASDAESVTAASGLANFVRKHLAHIIAGAAIAAAIIYHVKHRGKK